MWPPRSLTKTSSGSEVELRISLKPVIAALLFTGVVLFYVGDSSSDPSAGRNVMQLSLLFIAVAATAWALENWRPQPARWFTVIALVAIVHVYFQNCGKYARWVSSISSNTA